jgi:hypothetical protein
MPKWPTGQKETFMDRKNETHGRSRRDFLKRGAGISLVVLGAPAVFAACKGDEGPSCLNPPGLTPAQRTQRTSLTYVEKAADPQRRCDLCTFYTDPTSPGECGGCTLGLGPVNPGGSCNSFAPKT